MHLDEEKLFFDFCQLRNSISTIIFKSKNVKSNFILSDLSVKKHFGLKLWHILQLVWWVRRWETFPPSFPPAWSTFGSSSAPAPEQPGLRAGPGRCWSGGPSDGLLREWWWKPESRWCCASLRQRTTDPEPRCCNATRETQKIYQLLF